MAIICFVISDFIRQCSFEIHNIGNFLIIYIRHKSPLTPCDIMVASAAPDTPSLKTIINVRSSIIFKILEKEKISKKHILKKDFLFFSEVARYEAHNYFVLEIDELYEAEERGSAARRFILNKKLYKKGYSRFDSYYRLADKQLNHPLCVLDRDELLSWDEPGMLWRSAEGAALKLFVENLSVDNKSVNQDINGEKIAGKLLKDFIFWHYS